MLELFPRDLQVEGFGASGLQLGLRLGYIDLRRQPAMITVFGKVQRPLISLDCGIEQVLLGVQGAGLKIIHRELGVQAEAHRLRDQQRWPGLAARAASTVCRTRPQTSAS